MFDLSLPNHLTTGVRGTPPGCSSGNTDLSHPFALILSRHAPADLLSGRAVPLVLSRFATLAEAMQGAINHAEAMTTDAAPQLLAILDRDTRLVLAGVASDSAVAWCHPVTSAAEARGVVTEASQLRAQAGRAAAWGEPDLARLCRPGAAGRGVRPERQRRAGGILSFSGGREIARTGSDPFP